MSNTGVGLTSISLSWVAILPWKSAKKSKFCFYGLKKSWSW